MFCKKFLAFMLVFALALGLAGCARTPAQVDSDTPPPSPIDKQPESQQPTDDGIIDDGGGMLWDIAKGEYTLEDDILNGNATLTFWMDNEGFAEAIIAGFQKKYPGVKLEYQNVGPQDAVGKLALEGEAGLGADVYYIPHDHVGTGYENSVLGMMGRYEDAIRERFLSAAVETVDIDGALYGVPWQTESIALYYNKTLLQQLYSDGMVSSPEPATDWNEIITLAEKYNDVQKNRWTIRWQVEEPYYDYMFLTAFGYQLFGPDGTDASMIGFDTQEAVDGLTYFNNLRPIWNVNSADSNWDVTTMEFAKGETPYLISGPWSMEQSYESLGELGMEFGVTAIPKMDGHQPYTFSGVQVVCVSSYSKYPAAARALAMYITSDEMMEYTYATMGKIPALNDKYAGNIPGLKDDENVRGFMAQSAFSNAMPSIPSMSYYWASAKSMFNAVWDGVLSPEDASAKAIEEFNTLVLTGG